MNTPPPRRRTIIAYIAFYLTFASVTARAMFELSESPNARLMVSWMLIYLFLLLLEPWLISRDPAYLPLINALQAGISIVLLAFNSIDYFALLFIPPAVQSILYFQRKTAFLWIISLCMLMLIGIIENFPLAEKVGYVIIYPAAIFLFTGFGYLALQAEEAQSRSEALLADLQKANRQLQIYAGQVQELAAANERNRLARELHDSVTQIIFGLTLSAQAARILIDRDPARATAELDHMQVLAQNALAEMRALIQQLHPRSIAEEGLVAALRRLAAERQSNDGLTVDVQVCGERRLPPRLEEELFRVAQEALNNTIKHAHTDQAAIILNLEEAGRVSMGIQDAGVGFDPARAPALPGHLGLTSMTERIQALGGRLSIDSKPGHGTHVQVELALTQEVEHA